MKICGIVDFAGSLRQNRADLAAEIALPDIRPSRDRRSRTPCRWRRTIAHRPAELAPLQREHHDRRSGDGIRDELLLRRHRRATGAAAVGVLAGIAGCGASKRHPGVELESASSSRIHVLADVLEQRRRLIALAGIGQHAEDVGSGGRRARDRRAPPPAWRRSRSRRKCPPSVASARAKRVRPRRPRARSRPRGHRRRHLRSAWQRSPGSSPASTCGRNAGGWPRRAVRRAVAECRCRAPARCRARAAMTFGARALGLQHASHAFERSAGAEAAHPVVETLAGEVAQNLAAPWSSNATSALASFSNCRHRN